MVDDRGMRNVVATVNGRTRLIAVRERTVEVVAVRNRTASPQARTGRRTLQTAFSPSGRRR